MKLAFKDFDMNEVCGHFDYENSKEWKKIDKFIVLSVEDAERDITKLGVDADAEFDAFFKGAEYALNLVNRSLKAMNCPLEIRSTDLGEGMGYILVERKDTEESFAHRVFK